MINIDSLLKLQEYDLELIEVARQIQSIPIERRYIQDKSDAITAVFKNRTLEFKQLEVEYKNLEAEIKSMKNQVEKYKFQQLEVKKNEEYQALIHQIENTEKKATDIEGAAILCLMRIDTEQQCLKDAEMQYLEEKKQIDRQKDILDKKESELKAKMPPLKEKIAAIISAQLNPEWLSFYQQVKQHLKRGPFVTSLKDQKCQGCHLRVSNDVASKVKVGKDLTHCDNCGRLLFASK